MRDFIDTLQFDGLGRFQLAFVAVYVAVPAVCLILWRIYRRRTPAVTALVWGWMVAAVVAVPFAPVTEGWFLRACLAVGSVCVGTGILRIAQGRGDESF